MKKKLVAVMSGLIVTMMLAGCGTKEMGVVKQEKSGIKQYKIAISQFAEHGSLDNCRTGFLQGLEEEGIKEGDNLSIDYQNSQADTGTANQIALNFVSNKVDLICSIATPSAQSAFNAAMNTDIPVIYTAVTDPVAAQLAKKDQMPNGNVTGTSDKLPVKSQLAMIRKVLPDAKKIGIIYSTSEINSVASIEEYEKAVKEYGFELVSVGINSSADIALAVDSILTKVDCINNLTDNTVVSALPTILAKANEKKIPVFGSEVEQVKIGCLASEGIDYIALGKKTGRMAAEVLKGEKKANDMKFEIVEESQLYVNTKVAQNLGITLTDEIVSSASETFDTIAEK